MHCLVELGRETNLDFHVYHPLAVSLHFYKQDSSSELIFKAADSLEHNFKVFWSLWGSFEDSFKIIICCFFERYEIDREHIPSRPNCRVPMRAKKREQVIYRPGPNHVWDCKHCRGWRLEEQSMWVAGVHSREEVCGALGTPCNHSGLHSRDSRLPPLCIHNLLAHRGTTRIAECAHTLCSCTVKALILEKTWKVKWMERQFSRDRTTKGAAVSCCPISFSGNHTSPLVSEEHQSHSYTFKFTWTFLEQPLEKKRLFEEGESAGQGFAMEEQFRNRQSLLRVHGHLGCTYHSVKRRQFPSLPSPSFTHWPRTESVHTEKVSGKQKVSTPSH